MVIIVLALGAGLKDYVVKQVETFGKDVIAIEVKVPGKSKTSVENAGGMATGIEITSLTVEDMEQLSQLEELKEWYAGLMDQEVISYRNQNKTSMIMGVTAGVEDVDGQFKVVRGEMFTQEEGESLKNFIILGKGLADNLFGQKEAVGKKVKVGDTRFTVKGVLEERGFAGMFDFDQLAFLPVEVLQKKITGTDHIQFAIFKYKEKSDLDLLITKIEDVLRSRHNIDDPEKDDFSVTSMKEAREIINEVFVVLNILLIGLTSVSLVVGGVGIMNVMYVAVTERTFEIGLRKAVGARKGDIVKQFLLEALFLTTMGGMIGLIFALLFIEIAEWTASQLGFALNFPVSWFSILLALGFSLLVGVIFGYKPARKAGEMQSMEAMRKE